MAHSRVTTVSKTVTIIFLTVCAFLFCTLQATANLQFDVFPGYDSLAREGQWCPVSFEVKNDGPTFSGFIEFSSAQVNRNQIRLVPIELPTGTLKRVTITVFSSSRYGAWQARLVNEKGKVLAEHEIPWQRVKRKSSKTVLMGAMPRSASGVPTFPAIKLNDEGFQPAVARLQPQLFPDNPISLDGLQTIYLNSERATELKVAQVQALQAWLLAGGNLIIGVEQITDVNGTPWLRELMPCELTSVTQVKAGAAFYSWLRGLEPETRSDDEITTAGGIRNNKQRAKATSLWVAAGTNIISDSVFDQAVMVVAVAQVRDGQVVAAFDGKPLAVEATRGRGKITVLTFSPERQPFVGWHNRPWLWALLAEVDPQLYASSDSNQWGWSSDGVFGALIDSKQIRKLPLGWLISLLVVYLLVIGPVDQYWLKKINRQMLTWITFPCYVLLFSGLIYFIGFQLRAGDSEWNELHVVDVLPNAEKAILRGRTYASIYSPSNQRYALQGDQFMASLRGEYLANWGNGEETSQANVTFNGNKFSADVFVPVWTSQLYVNDWWQPVNGLPVTMTLSDDQKRLRVRSQHSRVLTDVRFCIAGRIYELGEVPSGKETEFALDASKSLPIRDFVRTHGGNFFQAVEGRRQTFGGDETRYSFKLPASTMAACFLSQLDEGQNSRNFISPAGLDLSGVTNQGILLAWDAGNALTEPLNRFTARRSSRNTLLRFVVPIESAKSQSQKVN
jgi:hypothetical protein